LLVVELGQAKARPASHFRGRGQVEPRRGARPNEYASPELEASRNARGFGETDAADLGESVRTHAKKTDKAARLLEELSRDAKHGATLFARAEEHRDELGIG
jgi:hypothetical protein